jgi:hypothetical protein
LPEAHVYELRNETTATYEDFSRSNWLAYGLPRVVFACAGHRDGLVLGTSAPAWDKHMRILDQEMRRWRRDRFLLHSNDAVVCDEIWRRGELVRRIHSNLERNDAAYYQNFDFGLLRDNVHSHPDFAVFNHQNEEGQAFRISPTSGTYEVLGRCAKCRLVHQYRMYQQEADNEMAKPCAPLSCAEDLAHFRCSGML